MSTSCCGRSKKRCLAFPPDGRERVLLDSQSTLTPVDHQTHRLYPFEVPPGVQALTIDVRYAPKFLMPDESLSRAEEAIAGQASRFAERVGEPLASAWRADQGTPGPNLRVPNLLTISLDDAAGTYRGAAHRHAEDQHLVLGVTDASPGLIAGHVPAGLWRLTLSAHTLVTDQCEVAIQIGADRATTRS
jgi:hypothetical protein